MFLPVVYMARSLTPQGATGFTLLSVPLIERQGARPITSVDRQAPVAYDVPIMQATSTDWTLTARKYVPWLLSAVVVLLVCFKYVWISDEVRIERLIGKGAEAVSDRSVFRVGNLIASDYADGMGFDKSALLGAAQQIFQTFDKIEVRIEETAFEQAPEKTGEGSGKTATVRLRCSVTLYQGTGAMKVIDDHPRRKQFVALDLAGEGSRWLVRRIEFRNVDLRSAGGY